MPLPKSKANLDQVFQILPNHTKSSQFFLVLSLMSPNTHGLTNHVNLNPNKLNPVQFEKRSQDIDLDIQISSKCNTNSS